MRAAVPTLGHNPPDTAELGAGVQVGPIFQFWGHPSGMFDDRPIHVHDVERSVRAVGQKDGTKPVVGRCEEFAVELDVATAPAGPLGGQRLAVDEVAGGVTRQDRVEIFRTERVAQIDRDSAGCRKRAGMLSGGREVAADRKNGGGAPRSLIVGLQGARRHCRIGPDQVGWLQDRDQMVAVGADKASAKIIGCVAKLAHAGRQLVLVRIEGIEPEVVRAQLDLRSPTGAAHPAPPQAVGDGYPTIHSQRRVRDSELGIFGGESLKPDVPLIGPTIAVGVLQIEDLRGGRDDQAPAPGEQPVGEKQPLGKGDRMLKEPIPIAILEPLNSALRVLARTRTVGIVTHLDDIEPPGLVKRHRDRALDLRLTGHQLHRQARVERKGLPFGLRGPGRVRPDDRRPYDHPSPEPHLWPPHGTSLIAKQIARVGLELIPGRWQPPTN
ncbi:MAG: hypothetical protein KatS3mg108_2941 [Isosphaeraceae bacterium]|nr:MAG: hypothetical protein KatS3mg108_2941 [Isosphaeraceae bacterium]